MPWKLTIIIFLAATFVVALGPLAIYVVGTLIAISILGLVLTLTVTGLYSVRKQRKASTGISRSSSTEAGKTIPQQADTSSPKP